MDLAHQQPTTHLKGQVQRGGKRLRHLHVVQRDVRAVVEDLGHRWLEPQGQKRPRQEQHDEAVEGDLAEQERPVVGENLAEVAPEPVVYGDAVVDKADDLTCSVDNDAHPRSQ
jgi:hypothetical protein